MHSAKTLYDGITREVVENKERARLRRHVPMLITARSAQGRRIGKLYSKIKGSYPTIGNWSTLPETLYDGITPEVIENREGQYNQSADLQGLIARLRDVELRA
jgi:hypothetical protein